MRPFEEWLMERCHQAIQAVYVPGSLHWRDEHFPGEREGVSNEFETVILKYKKNELSKADLTNTAGKYINQHIRWMLKYKQRKAA